MARLSGLRESFHTSILPLARLGFFMLMPWFWVSYGFYVAHDFKMAFLLYQVLGCLVPALLLSGGRPWRSFLNIKALFIKNRPHWKLMIAGCVIGNGVILGGWMLFKTVFFWRDLPIRLSAIHFRTMHDFLDSAFLLVILNPVLEELFWRGSIYPGLKQHLSRRKAWLLSAFFFGAWHWIVIQFFFPPVLSIIITGFIMITGGFLIWLYEKTGSLMVPIVIHALAADLPVIIVLYWIMKACRMI